MDSGEGGLLTTSAFTEDNVRRGFIKKVYSILSGQLLVTMAIMGFFFIQPVRVYSTHNPWIFWVAFAASFACLIALSCFEGVRRNFPGNLICLGVFTVVEGIMLGSVVATFNVDEVMIALGITVILVFALTLFALQTKIDFTAMGGILMIAVLSLFLFGIFAAIFQDRITNIVYASLGAFIFSCYIVFDTQLMLGGKHKYALDPEEYIFASLNLYLDVINLFLFILSIIQNSRN